MLTISRRFNGPPHSGNGGYVAGVLAQRFLEAFEETPGAQVEVTLRKPPPLETDLDLWVPPETESLLLLDGSGEKPVLIAEAEAVEGSTDLVEPVSYDEAVTASKGYAGAAGHPFPTCFVCGPEHPTGLHIYAGPIAGHRGTVAAPWSPEEDTAAPEFVWAALDCAGGWSAGDLTGRPMVLGRMGVTLVAEQSDLVPHAPYVVMGRHLRNDGRKTFTACTLYGPDGEAVAHAEAIWIAIDPAMVRPGGVTG
jgi:hypothetical protein